MIELCNICKSYNYKKPNETVALRNVSLTVSEGEMIAITGASGAGKSTLLHIIGGLCNFESGKYIFNGADVGDFSETERSRHRNINIGIIMQDFALIDDYTVIENVCIPLSFRRGVKNKTQTARYALERVGITHLATKRVSDISGGEKQRCAIARCICQSPKVILADEPTGQLDTDNSKKIMDLLCRLNAEGITVIVVTHDKDVASACKHIVTLRDGQIV